MENANFSSSDLFVRRQYINLQLSIQVLFVIKPTRCTNFTNLLCHETQHISDSSSVHHQELIHCILSNSIRPTDL